MISQDSGDPVGGDDVLNGFIVPAIRPITKVKMASAFLGRLRGLLIETDYEGGFIDGFEIFYIDRIDVDEFLAGLYS
jgi:hypothetical protein